MGGAVQGSGDAEHRCKAAEGRFYKEASGRQRQSPRLVAIDRTSEFALSKRTSRLVR